MRYLLGALMVLRFLPTLALSLIFIMLAFVIAFFQLLKCRKCGHYFALSYELGRDGKRSTHTFCPACFSHDREDASVFRS
ncbi:MAG: hypothetical protein Q7S15_00035 [bacterium]|nr:hypothetical protein [bacterium]